VICTRNKSCKIANAWPAFRWGKRHLRPREGKEESRRDGPRQREEIPWPGGAAPKKFTAKKRPKKIFESAGEFAVVRFQSNRMRAPRLVAYPTAYLKPIFPVEFMARC